MDDKAQYKMALRLAKRALDYIANYGTPPTPHAFEIFYTVCAGLNPKLNEAVASIVARSRKVTAADAERLYEEYISKSSAPEQVQTIGSKMSHEMSALLNLLGTAAQTASSYQSSLDHAEEHLGNSADGSQLANLVKALQSATREMSRANAEVTTNIETTRAQVEQLEDCLKVVREESSKDGLTGLVNRKQLDLVLDENLVKARTNGSSLCLMVIDIDRFRAFNDTHGHAAGDSALRYVASCVKSNIKGQDSAGRYGGEELAVILPETTIEHAMSLAERIRHLVNARHLVKKATGESMGRISVSIGLTECHGEESPEQCYGRVEQCLVSAKAAGRNQVSITPSSEKIAEADEDLGPADDALDTPDQAVSVASNA